MSTRTTTTIDASGVDPTMRHVLHGTNRATLFLEPLAFGTVVNLTGTFDELDETLVRIGDAITRARTEATAKQTAGGFCLLPPLVIVGEAAGVDCEATQ